MRCSETVMKNAAPVKAASERTRENYCERHVIASNKKGGCAQTCTGYHGFGRRITYEGRPTASNRCITAFAGCSSGFSAWNLIFT